MPQCQYHRLSPRPATPRWAESGPGEAADSLRRSAVATTGPRRPWADTLTDAGGGQIRRFQP